MHFLLIKNYIDILKVQFITVGSFNVSFMKLKASQRFVLPVDIERGMAHDLLFRKTIFAAPTTEINIKKAFTRLTMDKVNYNYMHNPLQAEVQAEI